MNQHGTTTSYQYGCRCELCKQAKRDARPERRGRKLIHGTYSAYSRRGCRCEVCKQWKRDEHIRRKRSWAKVTPLRSGDIAQFNRVCGYADRHCLTLKQAADELAKFSNVEMCT